MSHVGIRETCWFVIGSLLAAATAGLLPAFGTYAYAQAPVGPGARQLVIPFENATREPRLYWLTEGAAVLLTDELGALGGLTISRADRLIAFEQLRVPPVATLSHATVIRVGQVVGAQQVVIGSFALRDGQLVVRARALRLDTGRLFPEVVDEGPLTDVYPIFARLARRLLPGARTPAEQPGPLRPPVAAFEQYIKGVLAETPATQSGFLSQAVRLAPGFDLAREALWELYTAEGEHRRALEAVRPAGGQVPGRQSQLLSALSLINLGEYQLATDALTELNRVQPDAAVFTALGIAQLRRPPGVFSGLRAVPFLAEAVRLDPNDADLHFNLGYASWLERDMPAAIAALREEVRRNPADDAAHYVLGVALQATGANAEAAREKELARQLSSTYAEWEARQPGSNSAPRGLERVKTRLDAGRSPRIEDVIVAAGQRDQRELAAFHVEAGRRLLDSQRAVEAIAELRRAVYLAPYDSEAFLLLGRAYLRTGRSADAADALKIAVWADPDNRAARDLLATIAAP